jgi:hypothetical protein
VLGPLDDTLWHQLATTFDHVGTSDPRFFDRYWFAVTEPGGRATLQFTLGVYNNMDVVDGGFVVVHAARQRNLRVSRALRPRFEPVCGPLRVEVLEPLRRFRLVAEPGDHPVHGELEWTGVLAPEEERPHFSRVRGRVSEEYQRFNQIGECSGWLDVEGARVELDRWWGCRDHSWGVRPSMGIPEPVTAAPPEPGTAGFLFAFLFFSTDTIAGHVQIAERGAERAYLTGLFRDRRAPDAPDLHVVDADLHVEMVEGTRRFHTVTIDAALAGGSTDAERVRLRADALGPSLAMTGLGYSGGFDDGRGLGVWRGVEHAESDVWDVTDPEAVVREDGSVSRPAHRIQPVHVTASGSGLDGQGTGSMTMIATGRLPRHGLA